MEFFSESYRGILVVAGFTLWSIGSMMVGGMAYFAREWWLLQLVTSIPMVIAIPCTWFLPESPRWLLTQNKKKKAQEITAKMIRINKSSLDVNTDLRVKESPRRANVSDLFRTSALRKRTILLCYIWFAIPMVYYGLSFGIVSLSGNVYVNYTIMAVLELPAHLVSYICIKKFGRKKPQIILNAITALFLLAALPIPKELAPLSTTFFMIAKFATTVTFDFIYVHALELFPTVVRSTGLAVCNVCGRIGGIIVPFILELRLVLIFIPFTMLAIISALAAVAIYFLTETRGFELPDTIEETKQMIRIQHKVLKDTDEATAMQKEKIAT